MWNLAHLFGVYVVQEGGRPLFQLRVLIDGALKLLLLVGTQLELLPRFVVGVAEKIDEHLLQSRFDQSQRSREGVSQLQKGIDFEGEIELDCLHLVTSQLQDCSLVSAVRIVGRTEYCDDLGMVLTPVVNFVSFEVAFVGADQGEKRVFREEGNCFLLAVKDTAVPFIIFHPLSLGNFVFLRVRSHYVAQ